VTSTIVLSFRAVFMRPTLSHALLDVGGRSTAIDMCSFRSKKNGIVARLLFQRRKSRRKVRPIRLVCLTSLNEDGCILDLGMGAKKTGLSKDLARRWAGWKVSVPSDRLTRSA